MTLYKGKGEAIDPNNWRVICLKEGMAKIISIILANRLLLAQLIISNAQSCIRCQKALHSLRSAHMIRRSHGLKTHTLFIDSVKAFNSINHKILYCILKMYGIPRNMIEVIKKYTNCSVKIEVEKMKTRVSYNTGVQQGDNMAPPLFLFMMLAATEMFKLTEDLLKF